MGFEDYCARDAIFTHSFTSLTGFGVGA
jgi:hypothetical protein